MSRKTLRKIKKREHKNCFCKKYESRTTRRKFFEQAGEMKKGLRFHKVQ